MNVDNVFLKCFSTFSAALETLTFLQPHPASPFHQCRVASQRPIFVNIILDLVVFLVHIVVVVVVVAAATVDAFRDQITWNWCFDQVTVISFLSVAKQILINIAVVTTDAFGIDLMT